MTTDMTPAIERFAHSISDDQVAHIPTIKAIARRLEMVRISHAAAVAKVVDLERQVADFRALAGPREKEIQELVQIQSDAAIGCVLGDEDAQKAWLDAEVAIESARRFLQQHAAALPQYVRWAQESRPNVAASADESISISMALADAVWLEKLSLAQEQFSR